MSCISACMIQGNKGMGRYRLPCRQERVPKTAVMPKAWRLRLNDVVLADENGSWTAKLTTPLSGREGAHLPRPPHDDHCRNSGGSSLALTKRAHALSIRISGWASPSKHDGDD